MSNKVEITTLESISANDAAAVLNINNNFRNIQSYLNNTLSRDGTVPNFMNAVLDMNSHRIINLSDPVDDHDVVTLGYLRRYFGNVELYADEARAAAQRCEQVYRDIVDLTNSFSDALARAQQLIDVLDEVGLWYKLEDVEWLAEWVASGIAEFPYKSTMFFDDVEEIEKLVPTVMFSSEDVISGNFASFADTSASGLTIYAKAEPENTLIIPSILLQ